MEAGAVAEVKQNCWNRFGWRSPRGASVMDDMSLSSDYPLNSMNPGFLRSGLGVTEAALAPGKLRRFLHPNGADVFRGDSSLLLLLFGVMLTGIASQATITCTAHGLLFAIKSPH